MRIGSAEVVAVSWPQQQLAVLDVDVMLVSLHA
jgi:hypothetical protein